MMKGYFRDGAVQPAVDAAGWFHTKDRGSIDADGYLTVLGRMDNMFISGGENIYPEEIESALLEIPEIKQAIVVAISDSEFGQRPVAFLDSDEIEVDGIVEFLEQRLAKYKIPVRFLPWPVKEVGTGIKASRKRLADMANSL